MALPATSTPVAQAANVTGRVVEMFTSAIPGNATMMTPPMTTTERHMQQHMQHKLIGSIGLGGIVFGFLAGKKKLPIKSLNTMNAKYAAFAVGVFALLIAAAMHYRMTQEMEAEAAQATV